MNKVSLNSFLVEKSSLKTKFQQYPWVSDIYLNSRKPISQLVHWFLSFRQVIKFSIYVVYDYQNNYTYSLYVSNVLDCTDHLSLLSPFSKYFMLLNRYCYFILNFVFINANSFQIKVDNLANQHSCAYKEKLKRNISKFIFTQGTKMNLHFSVD